MSYRVLCSSILWSVLYLVSALFLVFRGHQSLAGLVQIVWLIGLIVLIPLSKNSMMKDTFIIIVSSFLLTMSIFITVLNHYKMGF
jgi:hypothetical protein